ncbi:N-acetylmuramoyl-L-alanine amidase [Bacillus sp. RG28]|uniref:N-acetylmuramoyl-L-alanine amidase n=1 Tax=Gottfriedia endophytica TaxID=2820819 RepID=A0A940SJ77_9BACI|nr:N-acetylmuramoyl-L-alanine amidase [Gottfriedia endophytica]MBP0725191.1 N-acetylmuramoyl-L-alanine amidase [Gottfriedia endophytica]
MQIERPSKNRQQILKKSKQIAAFLLTGTLFTNFMTPTSNAITSSLKKTTLTSATTQPMTTNQQEVNLKDPSPAYYWGASSPKNYPADNFTLHFSASNYFDQGDYFLSTYADDSVKTFIDGKPIETKNENSSERYATSILENLQEGDHLIENDYTELIGDASVFSIIAPFSSWVAYYYNNTTFTGSPLARQMITPTTEHLILRAQNGADSPVPGVINKTNYGVKYLTYSRLSAGKYKLSYKAGEGIKVYIDGKPVVTKWTDGNKAKTDILIDIANQNTAIPSQQDIHKIEIRTYNRKSPQDLFFTFTPYVKTTPDMIKTIVLDPGHGGKDTGAIGVGKIREKDIVLDVGKRTEALFKDFTPFKVYLTRSTDIFIPLEQRPAFAIKKNADAFVSIHANSGNSSASGIETYYYGVKTSQSFSLPPNFKGNSFSGGGVKNSTGLSNNSSLLSSRKNPYVSDSLLLGQLVQYRLTAAFGLQDRGVKSQSLAVIRENNLPAVLTELGFVTNKQDAGMLASPYWKQQAAEAIYMGILDFLETQGIDTESYKLYH